MTRISNTVRKKIVTVVCHFQSKPNNNQPGISEAGMKLAIMVLLGLGLRALDLGSSSSAFMQVLDTNLVDKTTGREEDCVWCQNCGFKLALNPRPRLEAWPKSTNRIVVGPREPAHASSVHRHNFIV
eukprot:scaffold55148_cov49-Cyclotella_meneghiniana.AAC.6